MPIPLVVTLVILALVAAWGARGVWSDIHFLKADAENLRTIAGNNVKLIGELLAKLDSLEQGANPRKNSKHVVDAADDMLSERMILNDQLLTVATYHREMGRWIDNAIATQEDIANIARAIRSGTYNPRGPLGKQGEK